MSSSEKMMEEIEMRLNAKEGFAKMDKHRDFQNGSWVHMMDLDSIEIQKTLQKVACRQG
jgi:hypothetical protein